jgi:membrane associated rhomboid family serine protease
MIRQARWNNISELPESSGGWEAYYPMLHFGLCGKKRIEKHISTTNILAPILVSTPETNMKFVPPVMVGDGEKCASKIKSDKKRVMFMMLGCLFAITTALYVAADLRTALIWFSLNIVMFGYCKYDFEVISSETKSIRRRAQYYAWMYCHGAKYIYYFLFLMMVLGSLQIIGINYFGSNEILLERYGLLYSAVENEAEWWRILTGPFLHSGIAHWLSNMFIGSAFALLAGSLLGNKSIFVFLSGAFFSFVVVYLSRTLLDLDTDGIIGISGGMASLIGYFLAITIKSSGLFPAHFSISTMFLIALTLLLYSFFISTTSFVCHFSGLVLGLGLGFTFDFVDSSFLDEEDPVQAG